MRSYFPALIPYAKSDHSFGSGRSIIAPQQVHIRFSIGLSFPAYAALAFSCVIVSFPEPFRGHMFDQIFQTFICQLCLIRPVSFIKAGEYTVNLGICTFDAIHRLHNCSTNVFSSIPNILPMAAFRDNKSMLLRKCRIFFITIRFFHRKIICVSVLIWKHSFYCIQAVMRSE